MLGSRRGIEALGERGQRRAAELTAEGRMPPNAVAWRTLETVRGELGIPLPD